MMSSISAFHIHYYPKNIFSNYGAMLLQFNTAKAELRLNWNKILRLNVAAQNPIECVQSSRPFQRNQRSNTPDVSGSL